MITRFAPSLTGYLHMGHVLHMLYVWGIARARSAKVISRIEDHDLSRRRPEYEAAILDNMEWLGFLPDEGMTASNAEGRSEYRQSDCGDHYAQVLQVLQRQGLVYGCECSRKQILDQQSDGQGELCYPGTCSEKDLPLEGHTVRFRIHSGAVSFDDQALGMCHQVPMGQCGDFSLRDRQGQWTYQFACACDDIRHGINLVIRGEDILASTARQILLFQALEAPVPVYFHHPLVCDKKGEKLSKRQRSESISQLRDTGSTAEEIIGHAAYAAGLVPEPGPLSLDDALMRVTESQ